MQLVVVVFFQIFGISNAHNWIHSNSRAFRASTLMPSPPRPSKFSPHIRVGQKEEFAFEWVTGHPGTDYFFVVLNAEHEDKLGEHTYKGLMAYINEAPSNACITGSKWQKRHVSCQFSGTCDGKYGMSNDGSNYLKQLREKDDLYIDRPKSWGDEGSAQFQYHPKDLEKDIRVSYTNPKWPWIEAVYKFWIAHSFFREWDIAPFTIEGKDGPGHYLIHMIWGGYRDVIDVDLLAGPSPDIYGKAGAGENMYKKIDHCQYKTWNRDIRFNYICEYIDKTSRDVSHCLQICTEKWRNCKGVNVIPLVNPASVKHDVINLPWTSCHCNKPPKDSDLWNENTLVCVGLNPVYSETANPEVDEMYTVIPDDPEDPIFYSTCYKQSNDWIFDGFNSASDRPQSQPMPFKVGDMCLPCESVEGIPKLNWNEVPRWKPSHDCEKCN